MKKIFVARPLSPLGTSVELVQISQVSGNMTRIVVIPPKPKSIER